MPAADTRTWAVGRRPPAAAGSRRRAVAHRRSRGAEGHIRRLAAAARSRQAAARTDSRQGAGRRVLQLCRCRARLRLGAERCHPLAAARSPCSRRVGGSHSLLEEDNLREDGLLAVGSRGQAGDSQDPVEGTQT